MSNQRGFLDGFRSAGILPSDSGELRLQKSLLIFATGLISFASMLWLFIYWQLGPQFSSTIPFVFQLLLVGNLVVYLRTKNFDAFRLIQLSLFLFTPFAAQWSMGNFISASGVSLWALLAPIGAVLFIGPREALAWFFAYLFLTILSGGFDYYLADTLPTTQYKVPTQTTVFFFALNFAAVSTLVFLLLRYAASEKQKAQSRLEDAHLQLQLEQDRSERLLLNILPGPIAERLKNSDQTIADGFADVSVMFVDIVNFTRIAEGLSPQQVFSMLNKIFSSFDELAEKYGLEKIKTIGDAYMVAGGLNDDIGDYSAALVDMALEMRDLLERDFDVNQMGLEVRIGIGTGPVVAGVVGKKKFIYDLWGDTVNIASRITSEGVPGMVQLDETTYRRLQNLFDFYEPQTIYLKGKGDMIVYRAIGRRAA
ncbi:adenylate/guanylate cyclase domain-containing protein [Propionivibrio sp.]|uniref:adenylate/guanylate cyclase domain-containing protein n=1 Tax=Propionivibrio sp. TaxID=2212460 RepID=UPI00262DA7DC|nr:adenylate/guanylate cyclase domain-containing protein [Propionivibrio sp.]